MTNLSEVPAAELITELLARPEEMFDPSGYLTNEVYELEDLLGTRYCVDGVPARRNDSGEIELMAILRNTGPNKGKLTAIGGRVGRIIIEKGVKKFLPESIAEAMARHFSTDVGFEIEFITGPAYPQLNVEQMRPVDGILRPGFESNPTARHCIASRYLVRITNPEVEPVFGTTEVGGQEAAGIKWFTRQDMPDDSTFGYMHDATYRVMFAVAEQLLS